MDSNDNQWTPSRIFTGLMLVFMGVQIFFWFVATVTGSIEVADSVIYGAILGTFVMGMNLYFFYLFIRMAFFLEQNKHKLDS